MKKYMLGLFLISSCCFADITLNTKITLIKDDQQIEENISFITELEKKSEIIKDDFKICCMVSRKGKEYCCEFEIYHLDQLITKPVVMLDYGIPGTIILSDLSGEVLRLSFSLSE